MVTKALDIRKWKQILTMKVTDIGRMPHAMALNIGKPYYVLMANTDVLGSLDNGTIGMLTCLGDDNNGHIKQLRFVFLSESVGCFTGVEKEITYSILLQIKKRPLPWDWPPHHSTRK